MAQKITFTFPPLSIYSYNQRDFNFFTNSVNFYTKYPSFTPTVVNGNDP